MNGNNYKEVPGIVLKGEWLRQIGFSVGDKIYVKCSNRKLIVIASNTHKH